MSLDFVDIRGGSLDLCKFTQIISLWSSLLGSQDLCKFSLDLRMHLFIYYTGMVCPTRFQDRVFG